VERAGEVGPDFGGVPHWRGSLTTVYTGGPLSLMLMGRYVGGGKYANAFVEGVDIDDNSVKARFYLNGSVAFKVASAGDSELELFGAVNNILDKDPPIVPSVYQTPYATNM